MSLNSPPPESRSLRPASSSEDSEPGRILIIDDQPSARAWARLILEHEFVFFTTGSAQEFLELAHRQSPDIFLADLEMQPISGIQLCRMVKSYPALAAVPFILLTAYESTDNKVASLTDGVDDHLPKSISPRELLSRIRATIRLRRAMLRTANLQGLVELRTQELRAATERLEAEIAERERIETELRLAQKLEAVGQLAAGIAHEINTPCSTSATRSNSHAISDVVGNSAAKGHIRVSTFCRDRSAFIVIEDTGSGIPESFATVSSTLLYDQARRQRLGSRPFDLAWDRRPGPSRSPDVRLRAGAGYAVRNRNPD